jgi:serine/threonine protein kinase/outer membrane protein assembly factor BamB
MPDRAGHDDSGDPDETRRVSGLIGSQAGADPADGDATRVDDVGSGADAVPVAGALGWIGPYRLLGELGSGGMGAVYLARSPGARLVAVKVIRPELADDGGFRERFRREVAAARKVSGAFTSPVLDADPDAAVPWLATSYVAGPSLKEAVEEFGPFGEAAVRALGAALAESLVAIHAAGLVHRDLKPANVLLAADGPRVIDFGISRAVDGTRLTAAGGLVGTPPYMSPEQVSGDEIGPASDVFSLASVLVYAATGSPPFSTGDPRFILHRIVALAPALEGVPSVLRPLLGGCLDKDASRRPGLQTILDALAPVDPTALLSAPLRRELQRRSEQAANAEAMAAASPSSSPTARPSPKAINRRRLLVLAGSTALVAVAGGGTAWMVKDLTSGTSGATQRRTTGPSTAAVDKLPPGPAPSWTFTPADGASIQSPLLQAAGSTVVWGGGGASPDQLWGVAAATGKQLWAVRLSHGVGFGWQEIFGSTVYATNDHPTVLGVDTATGRQRTVSSVYFSVDHLYAVLNRTAIIGSGGVVQAVDLRSGRVVWNHPIGTGLANVLTDQQTCYIVQSPMITALDIAHGTQRWSNSTSITSISSISPTPGSRVAAVTGTTLLVSTDTNVVALDTGTGHQRWTSSVPVAGSSPPVVSRGHVVVASSSSVYAFDLSSGALRWQLVTHDDLSGPPLAGSDTVLAVPLFTTQQSQAPGGFLVIGAADGKPRFRHQGSPGVQLIVAVSGSVVYATDGTRLQAFAGGS